MKKRALNKDIEKSITHSFGRFISIMLLMALGSFALVGLSVTGSDMRKTGINYFKEYNTADVTITSDYGLTSTEMKSIESASNISKVEYIYLKDVTLENDNKSFRIFSNTKDISMYELVDGNLPKNNQEIALDVSNQDNYKIGDKITFTEKEDSFGKKVLKNTTFKITGFIKSTEILSTLNRGQTTVGTGSLDYYAVANESAFDSNVYMMAKIIFNDTKELDPYSDTYNEKIISHKNELQNLLESSKNIRFDLIKSEYKDKIDEATEEITNAKQELENAKTSLSDAKTKIDNAKQEININEKKLNDANLEIKNAEEALNSSKQEINSKKQEIDVSKEKLDNVLEEIQKSEEKLISAKKELDSSEKLILEKENELKEKYTELENASTTLSNKKQELETNKENLENIKAQYIAGIKKLNDNISYIEQILSNPNLLDNDKQVYNQNLQTLQSQLETTTNEYNSFMNDTYNNSILQIEQGLKEIDTKEKEISESKKVLDSKNTELESSKQKLNNKNEEYIIALENLELAKQEYNKNISDYNFALEQIKNAETRVIYSESLINSKKEEYNNKVILLDKAKEEINEKEKEYYEKLEEYNNKLPDATNEINNALEELEDAKEEYETLESPVYHTYNRREVPGGDGYSIYETVSNIIDSLANVFPLFMYFVAALVTLTTMTRFVDEERINMGTLTSLGYKDKDIIKKFVIYGFLSAFIGTIIGVVSGHILIPYIVYNAYEHGFTIPKIELHFYLKETIISCILSLLCSVIPAYISIKNNLKEKPANLLLPKAPAGGSKILLEKIKPIWKRLNFTKKVTARNIFRYKKRMLMTIFGVAGASAILFTGFSVQKSISTINDKQFQGIIKYDVIVALNDNIKIGQEEEFNELLSNDEITGKSKVYYEDVSKETGRNNDKQEIKLIVPESTSDFKKYIDLHTRKDKNSISLDKDGVVISERLANSLNVKVGDSFTFEDSKGIEHKVKVSAICEMYAGHFIFMSKEAYETIYNDEYKTNAYMLLLKDSSEDNTKKVSASFMKLSATKGVVQNTTMYDMVNTIVKSLNKIMLVIIVLASLLTVVILFNLTNINVAERIRELSTIKVLGFRDNEVTMYIYRETIILSQIGIVFGWLFGILLHNYILTVVPPDQVMFDPSLWIGAYIIPFIVINIVTFVLKFYINKKLINVDMIEALKSVD